MINGLQVTVSGVELTQHLSTVAMALIERADLFRTRCSALGTTGSVYEQVKEFTVMEANCRKKASYFSFLASHLVKEESYQLSEAEILRIGMGYEKEVPIEDIMAGEK